MKPCFGQRKQIALLAANSLGIQQEHELRAHLEGCAGCRRYLAELASVTDKLRATTPNADVRPSDSFHRNLIGALAEPKRESVAKRAWAQTRASCSWRLVLPTAAVAVAIFAAWQFTVPPAHVPAPAALGVGHVARPVLNPDLAPTFSNYEMAVHQSLDKLDDLLTEQGRRNPKPSPIYTAAQLPRASMGDELEYPENHARKHGG